MLGLILSALVGTRKDLANRLLPAVILLQIVCIAPIARNPVIDRSVDDAYHNFGVAQVEFAQVPGWISHQTISRPAVWSLRSIGYNKTDQHRMSKYTIARRETLIEMALVWIGLVGVMT